MQESVAAGLDLRSNALNALRLVLATLVIVSHSFPISGAGPDPEWGGISLGTLAVGGFFAISGYLITNSRLRSGLGSYAWRRFLRIFPGFWVCLLFTAFVAAPVGGLARDGWSPSSAVHYVISYADMSNPAPLAPGSLYGAPFDQSWNGSLWSLRYEVACYVVTGLVLLTTIFWRRWLVTVAWLAATGVSLVFHLTGRTSGTLSELALLAPYFLAGVLILRFSDRLPLTRTGVATAAALLVAGGLLGQGEVLAPLPLAYLLIWVGARAPLWVRKIGARNDISYGTYLYAFPLQQLLVVAGLATLPVAVFSVASIMVTLPLAAASWFLIERPAMMAKRLPERWRRGASLRRPRRRTFGAESKTGANVGLASTPVPGTSPVE